MHMPNCNFKAPYWIYYIPYVAERRVLLHLLLLKPHSVGPQNVIQLRMLHILIMIYSELFKNAVGISLAT
jgi:hypothetical protein